jgi:hypothetical protein
MLELAERLVAFEARPVASSAGLEQHPFSSYARIGAGACQRLPLPMLSKLRRDLECE